jgi:hypothetical protein
MRFRSKRHMAQELLAGKRFKNKSGLVIYYNERFLNPFRCNTKSIMDVWEDYDKDIWEEVKYHVHRDLMDIYEEGQAWQVDYGDGFKNNIDGDGNWFEPLWFESYSYRLHPHNELIQAYRKGAKIQVYTNNVWVNVPIPDWNEDAEYRIKPVTKTVYEWVSVSDRLPPPETQVIVRRSTGEVLADSLRCTIYAVDWYRENKSAGKYTHWMPLPEYNGE